MRKTNQEENFEMKIEGMTLRDYFAAKALQGLISSVGEWSSGYPDAVDFSESVSHDAYWIADRMMEVREKND
jgi:hypothetical protein